MELVTPFEDLIVDGAPAPGGTFIAASASAVVGAMVDSDGLTMLVGSSTLPYGEPTKFSIHSAKATATWLLCDLLTNRSAAVSSSGVALWASEEELGTLLSFGPHTPCHRKGAVETSSKT